MADVLQQFVLSRTLNPAPDVLQVGVLYQSGLRGFVIFAAVETLPKDKDGKAIARPEIHSDNGSGYISREFHGVLEHYELTHHRIKPHCLEEIGIIERANRTFREALKKHDLTNRFEADDAL